MITGIRDHPKWDVYQSLKSKGVSNNCKRSTIVTVYHEFVLSRIGYCFFFKYLYLFTMSKKELNELMNISFYNVKKELNELMNVFYSTKKTIKLKDLIIFHIPLIQWEVKVGGATVAEW